MEQDVNVLLLSVLSKHDGLKDAFQNVDDRIVFLRFCQSCQRTRCGDKCQGNCCPVLCDEVHVLGFLIRPNDVL